MNDLGNRGDLVSDKRHFQASTKHRSRLSQIPVIGPVLVRLRQPGNELLGSVIGLAGIGYALVLVAAVVPAARGNGWLSTVGVTFLSVGTSASLSLFAAREASLENFRRDANLRRKDGFYGPLHAQTKQIYDQLVGAFHGDQPFPQWIEVPGTPHPLSPPDGIFLPGYPVPTLDLWPAYRSDYRRDAFTTSASMLFDEVCERAAEYDKAVLHIQQIAVDYLQRQLELAISTVKEDHAFAQWENLQSQEFTSRGQPFPAQLNVATPQATPRRQLFAAIAYGLQFETPGNPMHMTWARSWIQALPIHEPVTLGWLLANRPDKAASVIRSSLVPTQRGSTAPHEWFVEQFRTVGDDLTKTPQYLEWIEATRNLEVALERALTRLADGLSYIRDRYEGGEPPV